MKPVEIAKKRYRNKKGIKRMKIEPLNIKGTTIQSNILFKYKNNILQLVEWNKNNDYEFFKVR